MISKEKLLIFLLKKDTYNKYQKISNRIFIQIYPKYYKQFGLFNRDFLNYNIKRNKFIDFYISSRNYIVWASYFIKLLKEINPISEYKDVSNIILTLADQKKSPEKIHQTLEKDAPINKMFKETLENQKMSPKDPYCIWECEELCKGHKRSEEYDLCVEDCIKKRCFSYN